MVIICAWFVYLHWISMSSTIKVTTTLQLYSKSIYSDPHSHQTQQCTLTHRAQSMSSSLKATPWTLMLPYTLTLMLFRKLRPICSRYWDNLETILLLPRLQRSQRSTSSSSLQLRQHIESYTCSTSMKQKHTQQQTLRVDYRL